MCWILTYRPSPGQIPFISLFLEHLLRLFPEAFQKVEPITVRLASDPQTYWVRFLLSHFSPEPDREHLLNGKVDGKDGDSGLTKLIASGLEKQKFDNQISSRFGRHRHSTGPIIIADFLSF